MYADVAFPISGFQTFTYKVPESLKSKIIPTFSDQLMPFTDPDLLSLQNRI